MTLPSINSDLLVAALLRRARDMQDPLAWLKARHTEALDAVLAGDEYVTETSGESGANTAERQMPANLLLQLYESALVTYEAQNGGTETIGSIRSGDFSCMPCILG